MYNSRKRIQKVSILSLLLAVSLVLSYLESFIPVPIPIPGVKYGLANTLGLIILAIYSEGEYVAVSILRVVLMGLIRTGFSTSFMISMSGMLVSILAVLYFRFVFRLSIFGTSWISAIFHGIGQILMVAILYQELAMISYLPILIITGLISGTLIAEISRRVIILLKARYLDDKTKKEVD